MRGCYVVLDLNCEPFSKGFLYLTQQVENWKLDLLKRFSSKMKEASSCKWLQYHPICFGHSMGHGAISWPLSNHIKSVQFPHVILELREHYILPEAWGTQDVFKEHAILVTFITLLTRIPFKQKQHMTTASHPPVSTQLIESEGPQELRHLMALNNHRKDSSYTVSSSSCHPRTHSQVSDPCCRLQLSTRYFSVALPIC